MKPGGTSGIEARRKTFDETAVQSIGIVHPGVAELIDPQHIRVSGGNFLGVQLSLRQILPRNRPRNGQTEGLPSLRLPFPRKLL
jgi:hypothetical protein